MNLFYDLPLTSGENEFHAVVEIPKNSRVKYEYSEKLGAVMVDRVVKVPAGYPANYGFFPQTWNKYDNDPMDVIILGDEAFYPGNVVPVRLVGIIEMDDTGELDHKILAVPTGDAGLGHVKDVSDIPQKTLDELDWYLRRYKDLDKDKYVKILGIKDAAAAMEFLNECAAEYEANHKK